MTALAFTREHLRTPLTLAMLIAIPATFVWASADVLGDFARALGGDLAGDAAAALGAGWSAAFIAGALSYFQAASSYAADRRLVVAGSKPLRVACSRMAAAVALGVIASAAAYLALTLRSDVAHPAHAAVAVAAFALIYLAVGTVVGSVLRSPLEGSLMVAFVFLLDVFSGPGMSGEASPLSFSRKAADVLIAAATGEVSPAADWLRLGAVVTVALATALAVFTVSARRRT